MDRSNKSFIARALEAEDDAKMVTMLVTCSQQVV